MNFCLHVRSTLWSGEPGPTLAPALRPPHDALKTGEGHWARGVTTLIQLPKLMTAAGKSAGESGMLTGAMTVALAKAVAA